MADHSGWEKEEDICRRWSEALGVSIGFVNSRGPGLVRGTDTDGKEFFTKEPHYVFGIHTAAGKDPYEVMFPVIKGWLDDKRDPTRALLRTNEGKLVQAIHRYVQLRNAGSLGDECMWPFRRIHAWVDSGGWVRRERMPDLEEIP